MPFGLSQASQDPPDGVAAMAIGNGSVSPSPPYPVTFTPEFGRRLTAVFSEREVVMLATTAAQVNLWARTIQALGCPPQG